MKPELRINTIWEKIDDSNIKIDDEKIEDEFSMKKTVLAE